MRAEISYGKMEIGVYRTYARPLSGLTAIPESPFTGRDNTLFSTEVSVEVFGDNFMPAYTEGDNSGVVATDTMKNFVLREALEFEGSTLEGFLHFLGERFLGTYPQMHTLRLTGREQPFDAVAVPSSQSGFGASDRLFSRSHDSYAIASLDMERGDGGAIVSDHRCGCNALHLVKLTGSAFANFVRDEHTTLPERNDRPLFVHLDVGWKYADARDLFALDCRRYIAAEQVRDHVQSTFHSFVSMSIQHLVNEMGVRLLERFPQMDEVSFETQNRLWDTAFTSQTDERVKVYTDPRRPYGLIRLTLTR